MPGRFDIVARPIRSDQWINDGLHSWKRETLRYDRCTLTAYPSRDKIEQFNCSINGINFTMPPSSVYKAKALFDCYADAAMKEREPQDCIGHGFLGNTVKVSAAIKVEMADCELADITRKKLPKHAQGKFTQDELAEMGVYE